MAVKKNKNYPDNIRVSYEKYFVRRADKGLSEADMAERIGISTSQLSRWRTGHSVPSIRTLYKISIILECKVSDFFEVYPKVI